MSAPTSSVEDVSSAVQSAPSRWESQRSFDELGRPLRDLTFCVVDLETTGGSAEGGSMITEIGAVKVRDGDRGLVYALPAEGGDRTPRSGMGQEVLDARLARWCEELLVSAEASANGSS